MTWHWSNWHFWGQPRLLRYESTVVVSTLWHPEQCTEQRAMDDVR